jgi:hypothetical protein
LWSTFFQNAKACAYRWIFRTSERSGLWTRIAATGKRFVVRADELLTAVCGTIFSGFEIDYVNQSGALTRIFVIKSGRTHSP